MPGYTYTSLINASFKIRLFDYYFNVILDLKENSSNSISHKKQNEDKNLF